MEDQIAAEFREAAAEAIVVQRLGMQQALTRLERGEDSDPAKTAAYAARAAASSVDKLMTLTNRTPREKDGRRMEEIVRSLIGMKVLAPLPAGTPGESDGE